MSWEEYLTYLSSRWMKRFAAKAGQKSEGQISEGQHEEGEKEPLLQWWFGSLPLALKMAFMDRLRRSSR